MKALIIGIIIVALVIAGFWAYAKSRKSDDTSTTPTPVTLTQTPGPTQIGTPIPTTSPSATNTHSPTPSGPIKYGNHVGETLPDFRLRSLGRGDISLSQYRGIDVAIELWNSQCSSCINSFNQILNNQQSRGDSLVTLLINRGESEDIVRRHTQMFLGTRVMILLDVSDSTHRLLGTDALPYHVLIDSNGVIRELR